MAHAYTPGLKIARKTIVRKERKLPLKGNVLVKINQKVKAEDIVAKTELPGDVETINLAGKLGVMPDELKNYLKKKVGDPVEKDEVIAETKGIFGKFKTQFKSPVKGHIETISEITGQMIIREPPIPVQIDAYIDGTVKEIIENEGVVVETIATFVQGIFGIGGETKGIIKRIVDKPSDEVTPDLIDSSLKGKICIGGSIITKDALLKAVEVGAKAIVVGGINDYDLKSFLGYDIGVAITGFENKGITLIVTEGFGKMEMSRKAFDILCSCEGSKASCNGATQIRAGVMRPEVVIPLDESEAKELIIKETKGLEIGDYVRIIRAPYFGLIGKVVELPPELTKIETEAKVRILKVQLENGDIITLPRANVEIIEE
uniref:KOW domain-containing protein n=1 Tax=candidate division WOR-3 bacterium TaxID=2052148 RepID=A0A7C4U808_UNCW3